jgi:hypothetical protein
MSVLAGKMRRRCLARVVLPELLAPLVMPVSLSHASRSSSPHPMATMQTRFAGVEEFIPRG